MLAELNLSAHIVNRIMAFISPKRLGLALLWSCLVVVFMTDAASQATQSDELNLSGPYTHRNLTIFLIHGPNTIQHDFLTLQEAMQSNKVIVHETGNVNELAIENTSRDQDVYLQSGDILRGGKQDRVIAVDFIVPARSGKLAIEAFCVERGRWQRRGNESVARFESADYFMSSKDMKVAVRERKNQLAVWNEVEKVREKLINEVGESTEMQASPTSLVLALNSERLSRSTAGYMQELQSITNDQPDCIGFIFAINGEINSADVYASHELFIRYWPKLLTASATEALSELNEDLAPASAIASSQANEFLEVMEDAESSEEEITNRIRLVTIRMEDRVLFETYDMSRESAWIHRSYVKAGRRR